MDLDPKTDLRLDRVVEVPRALLWECWTTPAHIRQFFVPRPHSIKACDIDLRIGGRFNTVMVVDGREMGNLGVYLDIEPERKLVFTDAYSEGWKARPDPFMTAIILFEDAGSGATRYTAIARHRSSEARQSHEDMGFFTGWNTVLDQLVEYAGGLRR